MSKKVAVITGASGGLGLQATLELSRMGMSVILACRNMDKAKKAMDVLLSQVPNADAMALPLDVSEPESIAAFCRQFASQVGQLDLLINNAGVVLAPLERNSVGHELHLATNYLGPFALTGRLLPFFREACPTRVVNVGSLAHRLVKLDLDELNWETTRYGEWRAYGRSKLALQTFTAELDRRLRRANRKMIAVAAHPGFADTEAGRNIPVMQAETGRFRWLLERTLRPLIPKAHDATRPIIHAATAEGVKGGACFGPSSFLETRGATGRARVNPVAHDIDTGRRLWALSERMTGVRYLSEL
jgi:NAD(P)-dependent dehydrogenase (short-subunit alcohol dehydrogenase family)